MMMIVLVIVMTIIILYSFARDRILTGCALTIVLGALGFGWMKGQAENDGSRKVVKVVECKDFRDNMSFQFTTDNILESGLEFPTFGSWAKVRDTQGKIRHLSDSAHSYMRCDMIGSR